MKKIAIILHGCGPFDGTEIEEAVFLMLALKEKKIDYDCFAQNKKQLHTINHFTQQKTTEDRNVLIESARFNHGNVLDLNTLDTTKYMAIALPGGFGTAKNITNWAINGPMGSIDPIVKKNICDFFDQKKPILSICMSGTTVAKALENKASINISVGSSKEESFYNIDELQKQIESLGHTYNQCDKNSICIDMLNKIICVPAYMHKIDNLELYTQIKKAVDSLALML